MHGHVYEAAIYSKTKPRGVKPYGTGCPECSRQKNTSYPETVFYYYIRKAFPSAEHIKSFEWFGQKSVDIFIPEFNLCIEFDGARYHQNANKDEEKDRILFEHKMNIIRIREEGCPEISSKCKIICFPRKAEYNAELFNRIIYSVINMINNFYGTDSHITVNLADDALHIRDMMTLRNAA